MTTPRKLRWVDRGAFAIDWGCVYQVITAEKPNVFRAVRAGIRGSLETILESGTKRQAVAACERHAREKGKK